MSCGCAAGLLARLMGPASAKSSPTTGTGGFQTSPDVIKAPAAAPSSPDFTSASRASTAASFSDLQGPVAAGSPDPQPASGFLDCVMCLDALQMFGCCSLATVAALRSTSRLIGADESMGGGVLGPAAVKRLATAVLHRRHGAAGSNIHEAAEAGDVEAVRAHVILGANPDDYDEHGCVPLHYAADQKHAMCGRTLLRAGADINATHIGLNIRCGWTPLHFAAYSGARDVVTLLLLLGADVNRMDNCRRTPLYYAQNRSREACSRILMKFGGRAESHFVEEANLQEAQRVDAAAQDITAPAGIRQFQLWDASADASDMFNQGHAGAGAGENGEARQETDRDIESRPLRPYVGPAGDTGPNLTLAAAVMPGFEW